jgi:hypothetical protein
MLSPLVKGTPFSGIDLDNELDRVFDPFVAFPALVERRALLRLIGTGGFKIAVESALDSGGAGISLCEVFGENGLGERLPWLSRAEELRLIGLSGRLLLDLLD